MLKYSQFNKLQSNLHTNSLTERRNRLKSTIQEKKKTDIDTIIRTGEFIDFLQSVEHPMVWIKDDGDWYRFKFVDEIEMNGKNSTN